MLAMAVRDAPRSIGLGFLTFALCALSSLMCAAAQEGTVIAKDDIGVQAQQDWRLVSACGKDAHSGMLLIRLASPHLASPRLRHHSLMLAWTQQSSESVPSASLLLTRGLQ